MPGPKRNALEREFDLIFLVRLARTMGADFDAATAGRLLNQARARIAREQTIAVGGTEEEAELAAEAAQISPSMIRRQIRAARERAQEAARRTMGQLLDDQIAELEADVEESLRASESIWQDIDRSRRESRRKTVGAFYSQESQGAMSQDGAEALALIDELGGIETEAGSRLMQIVSERLTEPPRVEPETLETTVKETAATAALYSRLVAERSERRKLRAEMRSLVYGRDVIETVQGRRTMVQAITGETDPERAREIATESLTEELRLLIASEHTGAAVMAPETMRVHKERTADLLRKIRAARELGQAARDEEGDRAGQYTFHVVELDPNAEPSGETGDEADAPEVEILPAETEEDGES